MMAGGGLVPALLESIDLSWLVSRGVAAAEDLVQVVLNVLDIIGGDEQQGGRRIRGHGHAIFGGFGSQRWEDVREIAVVVRPQRYDQWPLGLIRALQLD